MSSGTPISEDEKNHVDEWLKEGKTNQEIFELWGRSNPSFITKRRKALGLSKGKKRNLTLQKTGEAQLILPSVNALDGQIKKIINTMREKGISELTISIDGQVIAKRLESFNVSI